MKADIAIITFREDEYKAIFQRFRPTPFKPGGGRTYGICQMKIKSTQNLTIAISRCGEQGNDTSQHMANDIIHDLDPQLILVVGIAGGIPHDEFTLGDVIISTRIHNLNVGAEREDGSRTFDIRGGIDPLVSDITGNLHLYEDQFAGWNERDSVGLERPLVEAPWAITAKDANWREMVQESLDKHFGIEQNRVRPPWFKTGSIASSNHIIRNPLRLKQWSRIARTVIAVEMEAAGVYEAAQVIHRPYPVMAIRGISDIIGLKRDGQWTTYACHTAAAFTYAFVMAGLIDPREDRETDTLKERLTLTRDLKSFGRLETNTAENATNRSTVRLLPPFMAPQLPSHGLYGRDEFITHICDLLMLGDQEIPQSQTITVALHGTGGIGKTTIASALGREQRIIDHFSDGILWVELGRNPEIRQNLERLGDALGFKEIRLEYDETACCDRLRSILLRQQVLLIVDDIWDEADGRYFAVAGPRCRTLITTREVPIANNLATAARALRVDVLSPEASLELLLSIAGQVVGSDKESARFLCEQLEFLPLALTLAGKLLVNEAGVPSLVQQLLENLLKRKDAALQLIQQEPRRGISEEHPSLRAILAMSVERLSKVDQRRFALLSVLGQEPCIWEIDEAINMWKCSQKEAVRTISQLYKRGLITPVRQRQMVQTQVDGYWMHTLLAAYAKEMLEAMV